MRIRLICGLLVAAALFSCSKKPAVAPEMDSSGFVNLTDVVPDAIIEARYFATYNFVGARVDGYLEPVVLYTREAAEALKAVSDDVKAMGYRLKVYDAYRPQCAVDHFVRWGKDLADSLMKPYFYVNVDKSRLFIEGYIAEKSGHTRGSAIDLTLFDMATGKELDMGGVHEATTGRFTIAEKAIPTTAATPTRESTPEARTSPRSSSTTG